MALIRTDPNQTKTVVVLLCILVMAIGVTVLRLKPTPVAQTSSVKQGEQKQNVPANRSTTTLCSNLSRNPFERPKNFLPATLGSIPESIDGLSRDLPQVVRLPNPWRSSGTVRVEPFDVGGISKFDALPSRRFNNIPNIDSKETDKLSVINNDRPNVETRPTFTLLATVKSPDGFSAVISINGAETRVVEVGDVLEGGFRVKMLTEDHALLSDGRENAIARRPQS
jgi:hypothetical protein